MIVPMRPNKEYVPYEELAGLIVLLYLLSTLAGQCGRWTLELTKSVELTSLLNKC